MKHINLFVFQNLRPGYMLAVIVVVLLIFIAAEALRKLAELPIELTRKSVHVVAGLVAMSFPYLFTSHLSVLILLLLFFGLLLLSQRYHFLHSINAITRKSYGSLVYPLIIYICFVVYASNGDIIFYDLPLLIFIISDPLAAFTGIKTKWIPYRIGTDSKTIAGSLAFFLSSFLIAIILISFHQHLYLKTILQYSVAIAIVATFVEAVSPLGLDNLFVPLSTLSVLNFFNL